MGDRSITTIVDAPRTTTTARARSARAASGLVALLLGAAAATLVLITTAASAAHAQVACNGLAGRALVNTSDKPLIGIRVQALDADDESPQQTTVTDSAGDFCLDEIGEGDYRLRVTLVDDLEGWLSVVHETTSNPSGPFDQSNPPPVEPVWYEVPLLAEDFDTFSSAVPFPVYVGGESALPDRSFRTNIPTGGRFADLREKDLIDLSANFYQRGRQYLAFWSFQHDVPLDAGPVAITIDNRRTSSGPDARTFYSGPARRVLMGGDDASMASFTSGQRPARNPDVLWHELTHHVQELTLLLDAEHQTPGTSLNHAGWKNESTADSITEGAAVFWPAVAPHEGGAVTDDQEQDTIWAWGVDLESNHLKAWSKDSSGGFEREDLAVAALLWDLWDGCDPSCEQDHFLVATNPADPATVSLAVVTESVDLSIDDLWDVVNAIAQPHPGPLGTVVYDYTVGALREELASRLPVELTDVATHGVDLNNDGSKDVAQLDVPFLLHGFFPCAVEGSNPQCYYVLGSEVGRSDHVSSLLGGLDERRSAGRPSSATIRVENPRPTTETVDLELNDGSRIVPISFEIAPGEVVDVPIELPPAFSFPLLDGALAPPCGDPANDSTVAVSLSDFIGGGALAYDACQEGTVVNLVDGAPGIRYEVGETAIRFLVALADEADADVSFLSPFADVIGSLAASGIPVDDIVPGDLSAVGAPSIDTLVEVAIPGLEELVGKVLPGVGVRVDVDAQRITLDGSLALGTEVLDIEIVADWDENAPDPLLAVPAISISLDLAGVDGDTLITAREAAEAVASFLPGLGLGADDLAGIPEDLALDSFGIDVTIDGADVTVDGEAFAIIGGVRVGVLVSADNTTLASGDPLLVLGARFDDASDPDSGSIKLDGLLQGSLGELAADLELPAFSMAAVLPSGTSITGADLRDRARDFLGGELPDSLQLDSSLSLAAELNVGALPTDVLDLFGWDGTANVTIAGELGFTLTDLISGAPSLDSVALSAMLPGVAGEDSAILPAWLDVTGVAFTVGWDGSSLEAGVVAPITLDVGGDVVAATLAGNLTLESGHLAGAIMASLDADWASPFGQPWLRILANTPGHPTAFSLAFDAVEVSPGDVEVHVGVSVSGAAGLGPDANASPTPDPLVTLGISAQIDFDDSLSGTLALEVLDPVAFRDLLEAFAPDLIDNPLLPIPSQLLSLTLGSGTSFSMSASDTSFDVDAVVNLSFQLFGPDPLSFEILVRATFPTNGDPPEFTLGIRPTSAITLGDMLPIELPMLDIDGTGPKPLDFTLVDPSAGSNIGFVFAADDLDLATLPASSQAFFGPLVDGDFTGSVDQGFSTLGAFQLPAPFDLVAQSLGFDPDVLLTGTLPIGDMSTLGLELGLKLRVNQDLLADIDMVDSASLDLSLFAGGEAGSGFKLEISMAANVTAKLLQGIDPALVALLDVDPINLDFSGHPLVAQPVTPPPPAGPDPDPCPRGGAKATSSADGLTYCYDVIDVSASGTLVFAPPTFAFALQGTFNPRAALADPDDPFAGWAPLGFVDGDGNPPLVVRNGTGRIEIGLNPASPTPLSIKFGADANVTLFGKNAAGAAQAGFAIGPPPGPTPPPIAPVFDGFRVALPTGISSGELVDLYTLVADALGAPPLGQAELDQLPNIGVRDLLFSVALADVDGLCFEPGIRLTGTLYVYNDDLPPNTGFPTCDPRDGTLEIPPVNCLDEVPGAAPQPDGTPTLRKDQGCLASVDFGLDPSGLKATGSVAALDLNPLPFAFTKDLELVLKLTPSEQLIKIAGAVAMGERSDPDGPITTEWASGDLGIVLEPAALQFAGQLDIFGFHALADVRFEVLPDDLLAILAGGYEGPSFDLHVALAAPELNDPLLEGSPDFSDVVSDLVTPVLDDLQGAVEFVDDVIADFQRDPIDTLIGLPSRLEAAGVPVPQWLIDVEGWVDAFVADREDHDADATLDVIMNGIVIDGQESEYVPAERTCMGFYNYDPSEPLGPDNPEFGEGTVDDDGKCWAAWPVIEGFYQDPVCMGDLLPSDPTDPNSEEKCYLPFLGPVHFPGVCGILLPDAVAPDSDGGAICTEAEVRAEVESIVSGAVGAVVDFTGLTNLTDVIDAVRDFLSSDASGPLFALDCADFNLALSAFGDNSADVGIDATIFGQPLEFGAHWAFNPADIFDIQGSVDEMVAQFWHVLFGGTTAIPPCGGVDPSLFVNADGSVGFLPETPPEPLPPVVSAAVDPTTIFEGDAVDLDISFDRPIESFDGPRDVTIDWNGDGAADETVTVPVGGQAVQVSHTYLDDDPSGTASDAVQIHVVDTAADGSSDTANVTVRNRAPVATVALGSPTIDEAGESVLTVAWTDDGSLDTHQLVVDWGDGAVDVVDPATSSEELRHVYADDDPTSTLDDDYVIEATVTDDDRGTAVATIVQNVANVAPDGSGIVISPDTVTEGATVLFTIDFSDVGLLDTHRVEVDFDGDGAFDASRTTSVGQRSVAMAHTYRDDDPTATPEDTVDVVVRVTDDDDDGSGGGAVEVVRTVTVHNVDPVVCGTLDPDGFTEGAACDEQLATTTIDEGETAELTIHWDDPGLLDTHLVVIDWGDDAITDTVLTPALGSRSVSASQVYGDNGTFPVGVTVVDDDTGVGVAALEVVVDNVDPTAVIDEPIAAAPGDGGTVLADGPDDDAELDTPTFIVRSREQLALSANATDPGSDDLTFTWDWDATDRFDPSQHATKYQVNPPVDDPLPSPTVQPRDITDEAAHAWSQPCLYEVGLAVSDDDAGAGADETWVVVTGTDRRVRRPGWWYNQYDFASSRNRNDISADTASCYLEIVRHMSRVFDTFRDASTFELAMDVLNTKQTSNEDEIMVRQLLSSWLNLAHGSIGWFDMVDTDGDRVGDTPFHEVLAESEEIRLDPTSTRRELLDQEDVLEFVNGG